MRLAPIVLFTYNRLYHTQQTIKALQENELASISELFIYSDGAKNRDSIQKVNEVREYIRSINGFKKVTIIERNRNWGLADSIIDGVTKIINQYGKIIVLEDDIITSSCFLKFMNDALDFYEKEKKVMHIGGYVPNIDFEKEDQVFLNRTMYCWGWATWKNSWNLFTKNINQIEQKLNNVEIIFKLNIDGTNEGIYQQFLQNKKKKLNTWAIFWYISIFLNDGLCLIPTKSYTLNIGNDSSGTNCGTTNKYDVKIAQRNIKVFISNIIENTFYLNKLKKFYKG